MIKKQKNKKGYTLGELLTVVAILVILFAVAVPSIFTIQKNLRQTELDKKAETIYMAVQERLTELYTSGRSGLYDPESDSSILQYGKMPGDAGLIENLKMSDDSLYYFLKGSNAADNLLPEDIVAEDLYAGHWVVELLPYAVIEDGADDEGNVKYSNGALSAASVYAVYYSDDKDIENEYSSSSSDYDATYRDRSGRYDAGAKIGYYGGANSSGSSTSIKLTPDEVKINNGEALTATVTYTRPLTLSDSKKLLFTFELSDESGHKYTFVYDEKTKLYKVDNEEGFLYEKNNVKLKSTNRKYTFTITLDDLSSSKTRFNNLYGSGTDPAPVDENKILDCGTNLTLNVTISCPDDYAKTEPGSKSATDNSLFASNSTKDTAEISNGRHLQNLDEASGVSSNITKAVQNKILDFGEDSSWQDKYGESYYNGVTTYAKVTTSGSVTAQTANFEPITNKNLESFTGGGSTYPIKNIVIDTTKTSNTNAGLFESFGNGNSDVTIKDIILTGAHVSSSTDAGYIVGKVAGTKKVNIENSQVYLVRGTDIPTSISISSNADGIYWLNGTNVGGLVGENSGNLTIKSSSSSSVLNGTTTGGLVGKNTGTLTVDASYADSYLYGAKVGGLVGSADSGSVNVDSCYAAGFIGLKAASSTGAGLVNGTANSISNTYTVVSPYRMSDDGGIDKDEGRIASKSKGIYYSTAKTILDVSNVYYFNGGVGTNYNADDTSTINDITANQLQEKINGDKKFQINTQGTQPYKLMGQSLSTYTYPRLKDLSHYGDWEMVFQSGTFGYYETYSDNTIGLEADGITSTLSNTATIVGDGYGVVFKENESSAINVTVKVGNETVKINTETTNYYKVTIENIAYRVYPLSKEIVNSTPSSSYYTKVSISQTTSSSKAGETDTSEKYYLYCPHFARSVVALTEDADASSYKAPEDIEIRSPRHLFNMSLWYDDYYRTSASSSNYIQERDLVYSSYEWTTFTTQNNTVKSQKPIGQTSDTSFKNTYDGGCYRIADISFETNSGNYVGLFGCAGSKAKIQNVVLATDYNKEEGATNYLVKRTTVAQENEVVWYGILAGYNGGSISNCAVAGYYLTGADGTIHGNAYSEIYVGGLVGQNDGTITNCEADTPRTSISTYITTGYVGGFVGYNTGIIRNSYGIGHIDCVAQKGETRIAGFVASNSGSINQCYCATALTASGDGSKTFGFSPEEGVVATSYFLNTGSYQYVDGLYAYETKTGAATYRTYEQLEALNTNAAVYSYNHKNTTSLDEDETDYPYKAVITNANGQAVHYGEWQLAPELGSVGFFYWEHEEGGENNGYKITYIGNDEGTSQFKTTLCSSHDDGGVITSYGYGYYVRQGEEDKLTADFTYASTSGKTIQTKAQASIQSQIPGYTFYPYTTSDTAKTSESDDGDYICFTGEGATATCMLTYKGSDKDHTYVYKFSPFFANAMQFVSKDGSSVSGIVVTDSSGNTTDYSQDLSTSTSNKFEIRSAKQLQYINWNYNKKTTSELVTTSNYKTFSFLMYASVTGQGKQTYSAAGNNTYRYWLQTHDLDAENIDNFVPIAGNTNSSDNTAYNATLYAWFGGSFDGQSYKIQELSIDSKSYTVGVFGVTVGAQMENIILYSENGATICRKTENTDTLGSYAIGGLIGVAFDYNTKVNRTITNCAIAGYTIKDESRNQQGQGEANVGGLIGVSNVNIDKCSAVTDIEINCTHKNSSGGITLASWGNYVRVGGIAGAAPGTVTNSYSGGTMSVGEETLDETYTGSNVHVNQNSISQADRQHSTNIFLAGIAGCGFAMNYYNFTNNNSLMEGSPTITNCYTYVDFPKMEGTIRAITMIASVADRFGIENGPTVTINNCYYLDSSAMIDTSNLPKYYFKSSPSPSSIIATTAYNNRTYLQDMLLGYVNWEVKMFGESSGGSSKGATSISATEKTYTELSSSSMPSSLGSSFGKITTTDASGANVDGKYSFPGSDSSLNGKNYPFPTVITQKDLTYGNEVNVHYGAWPHDKAYWSDGTATMDIFDNMDSDGWAYSTYTFNKGSSDISSLTKNSFSVGSKDGSTDNDYAEVVDVTDNGDGTWSVKVKAKKTGTTRVYEKSTGESIVLTITAHLNVSENPEILVLDKDKSENLTVKATSDSGKDYSTNKNMTWTVNASTFSSDDGDAGVAKTGTKNIYKITGYGYDSDLYITAKYDYNGATFTSTALALVQRIGSIGVSYTDAEASSAYLESDVKEDDKDTIYGTSKKFADDETTPVTPKNSDLYLYDTTSAGLLDYFVDTYKEGADGNSTISIEVTGNNTNNTLINQLNPSLTEEVGNSYRSVGCLLYEKVPAGNKESDLVTVTITVQSKTGVNYVFVINDYKLRTEKELSVSYVTDKGISYESSTIIQDTNYTLWTEDQLKASGYDIPYDQTLVGWTDDTKTYTPGETILITGDMQLKPIWKYIIVLDANDGEFDTGENRLEYLVDSKTEEVKFTYDADTEQASIGNTGYAVSKAGFLLNDSWNDKKDGSGKAYNRKDCTVTLSSIEESSDSNIIYVQWTKKATQLKLSVNKNKYTLTNDKYEQEVEIEPNAASITGTYSVPSLNDTGKSFAGWYTKEDGKGKLVAKNVNGKFVLEKDVDGYTDANGKWIYDDHTEESQSYLTLYAYWRDGYQISLVNGYDGEVYKEVVTSDNTALAKDVSSYAVAPSGNYELDGWYTTQSKVTGKKVLNANGSIYAAVTGYTTGTNFALNSDETLYACWKKDDDYSFNTRYTVSYDSNGGGSTIDSVTVLADENGNGSVTLPNAPIAPGGKNFAGWVKDGDTTVYKAGGSATITEDTTFKAKWKANTYTIQYDANGGNGSIDEQSATVGDYPTLAENSFEKTGYTFAGWSVSKTATTKEYDAGQLLTKDLTKTDGATVTLYAVWKANTYEITFNANGGSIDEASKTKTVYYASTYGALPTPTSTQIYYHFDGWYTAKTNGTKITSSSIVEVTTNTTLYAHWTPNTYTVKFHANDGSETISEQTMTYDTASNLSANSFTKVGYSFIGWAISENGEVSYTNQASVINLATEQDAIVDLYAVWQANTYNVTFNKNGGSGTMSNQEMTYDTDSTLSANSFTRTGYRFTGWATSKDGKVVYTDEQSVKNLATSDTFTLYAVWQANTYTIKYDSNGGTGTMKNQSATVGDYPTLVTNTFTRDNYTFVGWSKESNATTATYTDGQKLNIDLATEQDAEITLYAVWSAGYRVTFVGLGTGTDEGVYTIKKNATSISDTVPNPSRSDSGWTFVGWSTAKVGNLGRTLVIDAEGNIKSTLEDGMVLYACWSRTGYVKTDSISANSDYLIGGNQGSNILYYDNSLSKTSLTSANGSTNKEDNDTDLVEYYIPTDDSYIWSVESNSNGYIIKNKKNNRYLTSGNKSGTSYPLVLNSQVSKYWSYLNNQLYCVPGTSNKYYLNPSGPSLIKNPTQCYFYKATTVYTWSTPSESDSNTITFSAEGLDEEVTSNNELESVKEAYNLTLENGSSTIFNKKVENGVTELTDYVTPTRTDSSWTLDGWYTAKDGTGTKVLNADGSVVNKDIDGYTSDEKLSLEEDTTLYARWSRITDVYVESDELEEGKDYLITATPDEDKETSLVALGQVSSDADVYTQDITAIDPSKETIEYKLYNEDTKETSEIKDLFITNPSKNLVWKCTKDKDNGIYGALQSEAGYLKLEEDGTYSFTDNIEESTTGWSYNKDNQSLEAENVNISYYKDDEREYFTSEIGQSYKAIHIYKKTKVKQTTFADEKLSLTLSQKTSGETYSIKLNGNWLDDTDYTEPERDGYTFLGWFDSLSDDANLVLDTDGTFAENDIDGYIKNGKWIYDGDNLTLYAKWEKLPEDIEEDVEKESEEELISDDSDSEEETVEIVESDSSED